MFFIDIILFCNILYSSNYFYYALYIPNFLLFPVPISAL